MKEFPSMEELAEHLVMVSTGGFVLALHEAVDAVGRLVEKRAKDQIGHYAPEIAPFPEWEQLAESTQAERERLGFPANEPLLRTGELRDSISHEAHGLEVAVGSTSDIMVYQELGTPRIPARADLGGAMWGSRPEIEKILGHAAMVGIAGGQRLPGSINIERVSGP